MNAVKAIFKWHMYAGVVEDNIIGVYEPDKLDDAIVEIKRHMFDGGAKIVKETKDCCNYNIEFETTDGRKIIIHTNGYVLNKWFL